jgi:YaiO family outer membrane protein
MKVHILIFLFLSVILTTLNAQKPSNGLPSSKLIDSTKKVNVNILSGFSSDMFFSLYERVFNVYTLGVGYKGTKTSLYGYYNEGNLSKPNDSTYTWESQYELDFYHKLSKKTYYWLNYAYSNNSHFPEHRAMARIWQDIGRGFGVSAGGSYYYSKDNIFMANVGLEKYMGSFWIEGRPWVFFKDKTKYAFQLTSRIFIKDVNFVELMLVAGAAPDEPWRTEINTVATNYKAYSVMARTSTYLSKKHNLQLKAGVGYSYEEYRQDVWRNRYVGNVGLIYTIF